GCRDACEDLEQRRLAGAIPTDDAEHLTLRHLERDVLESPELHTRTGMLALHDSAPERGERVAKRAVGAVKLAQRVALRKTVGGDRGGHQIVSANRGSERRKYERPT